MERNDLAILNNAHWYASIFDAHHLTHASTASLWWSAAPPPPFHSSLLILGPDVALDEVATCVRRLEPALQGRDWGVKDGHARLDLAPLGFEPLFEARWIWRAASAPLPAGDDASDVAWAPVTRADELLAWESAWAGDDRNASAAAKRPRQFPEAVLRDPRLLFCAAWRQGEVVAGGVLNASPGAVGVSNQFALAGEDVPVWPPLLRAAATRWPGRAMVGFERGADLAAALAQGFEDVGGLRVWTRSS